MRFLLMMVMVGLLAGAGVAAGKVTTDGTNKDSPVKVTKLNFTDSGYGQPGANAEIRTSATIQNGGKADLTGVVVHLQLKNMAGDVVKEWVKNVGSLKAGATVDFDPNEVYYNQSFNNVKANVLVEHDPVKKG